MAVAEVTMEVMEAIEVMVGDIMAMVAVITVIGIIMQGDMAGMVGAAITGTVLTTMVDGGGVQAVYF